MTIVKLLLGLVVLPILLRLLVGARPASEA